MSIKMEVTRGLLKIRKEQNAKRLNKTQSFSSIYDILEINDNSRNAPKIIKQIALSGLKCEHIKISGVNCVKFFPKLKNKYFEKTKMNNEYCFLYIHGGGFVNGLALQGAYFIKALIKRIGCSAISVDYSLSPEAVFPKALNEIYNVYLELTKTYNHNKIIVGGESAGGNLALSLMLKLRDNNEPLPKCAVLSSGYFDLTNTGISYTTNEKSDPLLTSKQTSYMSTAYIAGNKVKILPTEMLSDPYVSPVYANLTGLPPMFISACEDELLYSDSLAIYKNCLRDKVKAELHLVTNCFHAYLILGDFFIESKLATDKACEFIKKICKIKA